MKIDYTDPKMRVAMLKSFTTYKTWMTEQYKNNATEITTFYAAIYGAICHTEGIPMNINKAQELYAHMRDMLLSKTPEELVEEATKMDRAGDVNVHYEPNKVQ
jgi:hypothetical protein